MRHSNSWTPVLSVLVNSTETVGIFNHFTYGFKLNFNQFNYSHFISNLFCFIFLLLLLLMLRNRFWFRRFGSTSSFSLFGLYVYGMWINLRNHTEFFEIYLNDEHRHNIIYIFKYLKHYSMLSLAHLSLSPTRLWNRLHKCSQKWCIRLVRNSRTSQIVFLLPIIMYI